MKTPKSSSVAACQQTLDCFINISDVVKAETIWTLKILDRFSSFALRSSDNQSNLFFTMFPDSARGFQMERTMTMYDIINVLAIFLINTY